MSYIAGELGSYTLAIHICFHRILANGYNTNIWWFRR